MTQTYRRFWLAAVLAFSFLLAACGGGGGDSTSLTGGTTSSLSDPVLGNTVDPVPGNTVDPVPGNTVSSASTGVIAWQPNPDNDQVTRYTIEIRNLDTNLSNSITLVVAGANPDVILEAGQFEYSETLSALGFRDSGTYAINIIASNSAGDSIPSPAGYVSF